MIQGKETAEDQMSKPITQVTTELYELLEPLPSDDRRRSLAAAMALLNEEFDLGGKKQAGRSQGGDRTRRETPDVGTGLGDNATRWMIQNKLNREALDQMFHINSGKTELIASDVPGKSRKEKTVSCYLLVGIRNLLSSDEPQFGDKEALEFCHLTDAYDKNNHTANRNALGNRVSGDRTSGFNLTVPGLRDAAKLIKEMADKE